MPPILIAFFILLGGALGPPLVKGLDPRPDGITRPKLGKPAPQAYRTWTSVPWVAEARRDTKACEVTYFALATRNRIVRLLAGGVEQELDSSWSITRTLRSGEARAIAFEFRDPVGGAQLACQVQTVTCLSPSTAVTEVVEEGWCSPKSRVPSSKFSKPRFVGLSSAMTMFDPAVGGAFVDVEFKVAGDVGEDWYCPRIDVDWPDGTRTMRESDCPPFESRDPGQRFSWRFNHGFPSGEWRVKACISKSGKLLACEVVVVRVVGG